MSSDTLGGTTLDEILMNPKRFAIAVLLYLHGPMNMSELRRATGLTWGDLDHNIRVLRDAGYVVVRRAIRGRPVTMVELSRVGRERLEKLMETLERLARLARSAYRHATSQTPDPRADDGRGGGQ